MRLQSATNTPNVKIFGKKFETPEAQASYIKDVQDHNSQYGDWDSDYDFIKGFRGRGAEMGAIAGALGGGGFVAYKCVESVLSSAPSLGSLVGGLVLGTGLTVAGFWASGAAGGAAGYAMGWAVDKSSQALGAPEVWFKNG